jgi:hypothetical protein
MNVIGHELVSQLKDNPRLRWGLWCILGILWFYGILLLGDEVQLAQTQFQSVEASIARSRAQESQKEWPERVAPAKLLAVELEGRLWLAATQGLAQAAVQDWLNQAAAQAGVAKPRITMTALDETQSNDPRRAPSSSSSTAPESPAAPPADLWKIRAKVELEFAPGAFMALLSAIESSQKQLIVETLTIRREPVPRAEIVLVAYFQRPASVTEKPPAPQPPSSRATTP